MKCRGNGKRVLSAYRISGLTRADIVVLIAVLGGLFVFLLPLLSGYGAMHAKDMYARCGKNLASIGKAISTYANDYEYMPPIAGGPATQWGPGLANWMAESKAEVFGLSSRDAGAHATISSSLYLLVRHAELAPEFFVCPLEKEVEVFDPQKYNVGDKQLSDLWDFGPDPAKHCSYAYHMAYGQFRPQTPRRLVLGIAADRNPWIDSPLSKAQDFSLFDPDKTPFKGRHENDVSGNSMAHRGNNQNILYLDGHVEFVRRSYHTIAGYQMRVSGEQHELRSVEEDNIYTSWDGEDRRRGIAPKPYESKPAHEFDSLLVNDPPLGR